MPRIINFEGQRHAFPDDATDEEISEALEALSQNVNEPSLGRIPPHVQKARDQRALGIKMDELDANPTDAALQKEIAYDRRRLGDAPAVRVEQPVAPSQADVRKSEASDAAVAAANPAVARPVRKMGTTATPEGEFTDQWRQWKAAGAPQKPGQSVKDAVSEWTGMKDPRQQHLDDQVEQTRSTGEVIYGDSWDYTVAKTLAAIAGGSRGGPAGATLAEALIRYIALRDNLDRNVKAGSLTQEQADQQLNSEMNKGVGTDALFNFGAPALFALVKNAPGVRQAAEKIHKLWNGGKPSAAKVEQGARNVEARAALGETDVEQQAVRELSSRMEPGALVTPGQVTGSASRGEELARQAEKQRFNKHDTKTYEAAEQYRRDLLNAPQPTRESIGTAVTDSAEDLVKAMKERTAPAFEKAKNLGVTVDMTKALAIAKGELRNDAQSGGALLRGDRAALEKMVENLEGMRSTGFTPRGAMDFISGNKATIRDVTRADRPGQYYNDVLGQLNDAVQDAYNTAAAKSGNKAVADGLRAARDDYREVMGSVFEDTVKATLRKNPEDIARQLFQAGNVTELKQLNEMMRLGVKEGSLPAQQADAINEALTRAFLQKQITNPRDASNWSQTLASSPEVRETWDVLKASGKGAKELDQGLQVLEAASKMATRQGLAGEHFIVGGRAAHGGMGYGPGGVKAGIVAVAMSYAGLTKAMTTALTSGNKGVYRDLVRMVRAANVGTPAAAKTIQETLPRIKKFAAENNIDLIVDQEQETQ